MASKRFLNPLIWTDEHFTSVSLVARLLFIGIINHADDEGRQSGSANELRLRIFPGEVEAVSVEVVTRARDELHAAGMIAFWHHNGKPTIALKDFSEEQPRRWRSESKLPAPPESAWRGRGEKTDVTPTEYDPKLPLPAGGPPRTDPTPPRGVGVGGDVKDIPPDKPAAVEEPKPKKPRRPEPTPEAKALEAEVRAFEAQFATRYAQVTGGPYAPSKGDRFVLRALVSKHGREPVNRATAAMFARHRAGKLVWGGASKAPTVVVLNAMWNDLTLAPSDASHGHSNASAPLEALWQLFPREKTRLRVRGTNRVREIHWHGPRGEGGHCSSSDCYSEILRDLEPALAGVAEADIPRRIAELVTAAPEEIARPA